VIVGDEVKMPGWSRGSLQAHSNSEIYFNGQPNAIFILADQEMPVEKQANTTRATSDSGFAYRYKGS